MNEIEDQLKIIEKYQDKVAELNHLLNEGMLDRDEYDELVQDFNCLLYTSDLPTIYSV